MEMKWIDKNKRSPKHGDVVLVARDNKMYETETYEIKVALYSHAFFVEPYDYDEDDKNIGKVEYWLPIPKHPEDVALDAAISKIKKDSVFVLSGKLSEGNIEDIARLVISEYKNAKVDKTCGGLFKEDAGAEKTETE